MLYSYAGGYGQSPDSRPRPADLGPEGLTIRGQLLGDMVTVMGEFYGYGDYLHVGIPTYGWH